MPLFNHLFGKKPNTQAATTPEAVPEPQPKPEADLSVSAPKPDPQKLDPPIPEPSATPPAIPNIPWRTFSIFISSTFADMQAERDHLKNVVFPLVEEELQKRRIKLEIVDLRWGVDTTSMAQEDEREANVLKVCLDEIRRCRPFFIGLLGDRYGWVPPLERMKTALVGEDHIKPEKGKSVTDLEIEFGVLASQEQLVRSVFYFREPLPYATFSKKKAAMFSDEYNDELSEAEKKERKIALIKLKARIVEHFTANKLENKVKTYPATWDAAKEKVTDLKSWGDTVYADILAECESHAKETWNKVPQNWQEQELALLNAFIEQHTHITTNLTDGRSENVPTFCGREELLKVLTKHLLSDDSDNWGLVLTGESGSGKSAVFSMVCKLMQERKDCFILAHSAGLSPRAKSVADLLRIWNRQLAEHLGIEEDLSDETKSAADLLTRLTGEQGKETTTPIEKLQEKFLELLHLASAKKRVVLLIDALDRFEPTARAQHLSWLPSVMPKNARMLCTAITGTEKKAVQYHKGLTPKSIEIFSKEEAQEMLNALCKKNHKTLAEQPQKIILKKARKDGVLAISSPLWLSLAANMLMALDQDDFEKISKLEGSGSEQIETYLVHMANEFDPQPGPLFISLTQKAGEVYGFGFTKAVFDYLAISRNGLREKDLQKLLPATNIDWDSLKFASLRRWFKAHLVLQGEELQWNLAHSILRNTLQENLTPDKYTSTHFAIATHLLTLPSADSLRASETMFHLLESEKLLEAANYYSGYLTESETLGATVVMAEAITGSENGLKKATQLPHLLVNRFALLNGISRKYIYNLNKELKIEGNLQARLNLLTNLYTTLQDNIELKKNDARFGYNYAALSALLATLGDIHQSMGQMEEALKYLELNNKLREELYEANPQDEIIKNFLAASYQYLGSIHQLMGHMEEALKYFEGFNQLTKELYEANLRSEHYKVMFTSSNMLLVNILLLMGHMEEALKYFEGFNQLTKELYEANPRNEELKNGLAISYYNLGSIHELMGHMEEALKYFENYNQLIKELYESNPLNEGQKQNLGVSYQMLGSIHQSMGHTEKALKYNDEAVRLCKELYEGNPLNEKNKLILGLSYNSLGSIHQSMNHMEEALKYFEIFNQLSKEQYESNPLNEVNKSNLVNSYDKLAVIHKSMGHIKEALKYFKICNQLYKEFNEVNPLSWHLKNGLALSYEELGSIHKSMGEKKEALKYFELNNKLSKELYEDNHQEEKMKNFLADSYQYLGSIHESMGHMKEALKYFEIFNHLSKELYEANPNDEQLKKNHAISNSKLGSIYLSKGQMKEALKYITLKNPLNIFRLLIYYVIIRFKSIH